MAGNVDLAGADITGSFIALTENGDLALDAKWNNSVEGYYVDLSTNDFPIHAFLPTMGVGQSTINVKASGQGLDFMSRESELLAEVDFVRIQYNNREIHDMKISAAVNDGIAKLNFNSLNSIVNVDIKAMGNLAGDTLDWEMQGDVARLDLLALGMSDTLFDAITRFDAKANYVTETGAIDALLNIAKVDVEMGKDRFATKNLVAHFLTNDSMTLASVRNNDLELDFVSHNVLDSLTGHFDEIAQSMQSQISAREIDIDESQRVMPKFDLTFKAANDNILHNYLADNGIYFDTMTLKVSNQYEFFIDGKITELDASGFKMDELKIDADHIENKLRYSVVIDNKPGTNDEYAHVSVSGDLGGNMVSAKVEQRNISGNLGTHIGANVSLSDSTVTLSIIPENPVIDYRQWYVNSDNFVMMNFAERHIDANLDLSNDVSRVSIFTDHKDVYDGEHRHQEDVNVIIDNIRIEEWLAVNPFAPPINGGVSANLKLSVSPEEISGKGSVTVADLIYGKSRVGTFDLGVNLSTLPSKVLYARTSLSVDGREVMYAHGHINDTTSVNPFLLDFTLEKFPLSIANPFIGAKTGSLVGYLNGEMDITGSMKEPKFNGYIQFDSATINLNTLGSKLSFTEGKIPMDSNVVKFNNYPIYGINKNPLTINGVVDMRKLSNIGVDLKLNANDMQIVGGKRKKGADMYGNAFISLDATAKGSLKFLRADADLYILPGTNVTYVIPGGVETITPRSSTDMVKFVNFADSTSVENADSIAPTGMIMNLDANLHIAQGATIGVDLSSDGINRLQIQPDGGLDFTMDYMGDTRLSGRLNVNKGYFRYSPPVVSTVNFDFLDGSYITFNGGLLNPQLNVKLQQKVKANVTQENQNSRVIDFLVGLGVTGSLQNMDVAFDLSTDGDITVANELQSMSAEQRANQAMNLLLYGAYTGPSTKASSNMSGNPLYSFLESQLNNWMARNVKAVDISFGFDKYNKTADGATSSTTSYSYKVSKTFLNDRFKIVVGGNYTTDSDLDENLSQNLINDISFEYMINRTGSMYVKLFRHTGYESILEGEITQTGVGFVYRRKLSTLRDMFRWVMPSKEDNESEKTQSAESATSNSDENENKD